MTAQMKTRHAGQSAGRWTALLLVSLAVSLFCLGYPIYVIRPFRHQGPAELRLALELIRIRETVIAVAAVCSIVAAIRLWRGSTAKWRGRLAIGAAAAVIISAGLAPVNVYELMFHPVDRPEFVPAAATKLDAAEKVLAIGIGEVARAYPVRSISYHHVVNDRVGGVPIVATY